jgi:hypothetical protein
MKEYTVKRYIIGILCAAVVGGFFGASSHFVPQWMTHRLVQEEAEKMKESGRVRGEVVVADGWGSPLKCGYHVDEKGILYEVISAGRDGKFETDDDIVGCVFEERNK